MRQWDDSNGPVVERAAPSTASLGSQQASSIQSPVSTLASQRSAAQPQEYASGYQLVSSGMENLALEQPNVEPVQESQESLHRRTIVDVPSREIRGRPKAYHDRKGKGRR